MKLCVFESGTCVSCGAAKINERQFCGRFVNEKTGGHRISGGPGTELKKLLKRVGITATPNCSCNARARTMDERGCDWCEQNLDEIVGWLREEAAKRGLPFIDMAGRMLIKRAITNARRADGHRPD